MAATLKMKLFLVILAFGFLSLAQVDGLQCYTCVKAEGIDQDCSNAEDCPGRDPSCTKVVTTDPIKSELHACGKRNSLGDSCEPYDLVVRGVRSKGVQCQCLKDKCNSGGHLHGWTFVQLIVISFVVVIVGADGAKP